MTGLLLQACSEADLPQRSVQADDCLRDVQLDQLQQALKRCDQVVARYPRDPAPRNERSLLLSLNGQDQAACREIEAAHALARQAKAGSVDPLLASELRMRRQSCLASP
ncbi:MAG: hypothetical protein RLZZ336_879 [Cyanobacteriota bacterium]|jgi:hypothetical protein